MDSTDELNLLLSDHLPPECIIHDCIIKPLGGGCQNFSCYIKEVNIYIENKEKKMFQLDLIMKVAPEGKKQIEVNSKLGFQKEANFYQLAVPEYCKVQVDHSMGAQSLFPKFYAASDKVIVLGDLRSSGYNTHKQCLDDEHTKLVLQELAKFHATGVALKFSNSTKFQSILSSVATPALQNAGNAMREDINRRLKQDITTLLTSMEGFESYAEPVNKILSNIDEIKLPLPSEPYATLLHNDLWIGNILFKYASNSEQKDVKFIDFQTTIYNSPARDLVYFLFTSVEEDVLRDFDSIISFYHRFFVDCLSNLGCDPLEFTFEKLMDEINIYGPTKLKHIILLFKTLCSSENNETNFKKHLQRVVMGFKDRVWFC